MTAATESIRILGRFRLRRSGVSADGAVGLQASGAAVAEDAADLVRWHELRPPGSFALCADAAFDAYVACELTTVVKATIDAVARFRPLGMILTGSLARGEGALIRERDGRTRWLSDIECLVVVPDRDELCGALGEALTHAAALLKTESASHAAGLNIQLSPILASRLRRMSRTIFGRELAAHGKLLWGRPLAIAMTPPGSDGLRALRADAFRLLNNRIVEQVALRARAEDGEAAAARYGYGLGKFWTELATSLSVFLDCYRTSYRERQLAIEAALAAPHHPFEGQIADELRDRLDTAMRVRRGELHPSQWPQRAGFASAASLAQRVWLWESARMLAHPDSRIDADWRAIPRRLRCSSTLSQRGRDWARWCLRPDVSRRMGVRALPLALCSGSPGNAIYAAGCLLEFFWDDIGAHRGRGREITKRLGTMFGLGGGRSGLPARRQLVGRAVAAWHSHLRAAPL